MQLFVGNLPYKTTEEELREMFEVFGSVSEVKIVTDRYTGQSRGFGFVEMPDENEAQAAINKLNGATDMGRALVVNKANERGERRPSRPRESSRG